MNCSRAMDDIARVQADVRAFAITVLLATFAPSLAQAAFVYRDHCPEPMTLVDTDAFLCRTIEYQKVGKNVADAYDAQVASLKEGYTEPEYADQLKEELDVLAQSQAAWQSYMANQCAQEGFMARGGSLQTQLLGECVKRLGDLRVKELQDLTEGLGGR